MTKHQVVLGYCHTGVLHHHFVESLINLSFYDAKHENVLRAIISVQNSYIPDARNNLVTEFLKQGGEWLISVDHDMVFEPSFAEQMLRLAVDNPDKKIIGALYFNWLNDKKLWSTWMEKTDKGLFTTVTYFEANILRELSSCGMGGTIIHRSVFEKIAELYKHDPWKWYAHDCLDIGNGMDRVGEDLTFCWRAKQSGFKTWGYSGITLGHVKTHVIDAKTFENQPWVHTSPINIKAA